MGEVKLTKAQRELLRSAARVETIWPRLARSRVALALEERGLLKVAKVSSSVGYAITPAGRGALSTPTDARIDQQ